MSDTKVFPAFLHEINDFPLPDFFDELADNEHIGFVIFGEFLKFAFYVPDPCWMARLVFDQRLRKWVPPKFDKVTSRQSSHDVVGYWRDNPEGTRIARRCRTIRFNNREVEKRADGLLYSNLSYWSSTPNIGRIVSASDMFSEWKWARKRNGDR